MGQSIFDYETKAFLSILAISLIGMAIVVSQQPLPTAALFIGNVVKKAASNTYIIKNIDISAFIGKDIPVLTKNELAALADGKITTTSGKTDYSQYLILRKIGDNGFDGGSIIFGTDQNRRTGNYLYFEKNKPLFEYALVFSSGLSSRIVNNKLVDLENKYLTIMGKSFVIVQTFIDTNQKNVRLRLMGSDGIIDFEDKNYADNQYEKGVNINSKHVEANLKIIGYDTNNRFTITELRYAPLATTQSTGDLYIAPRQGLRGRLRDPKAMLVQSLELIYGGIPSATTPTPSSGEFILFAPKGTTKYDLTFANELGVTYTVPLASITSGTFKYGSNKNLRFIEGNNNADFIINRGDLFIVNNKNDINGVTNILEYNTINPTNSVVYFMDIGTGEKKAVPYDPATGQGSLTSSGNTYTFYASSTDPYPIVIDQNGDGIIDGGKAKIVLRSGGQLSLGSSNVIAGSSTTLTLTTPKRLFAQPSSDELVTFSITKNNGNLDIIVPDQDTITMNHERSGLDKGLTNFGVYFLRDTHGKTASQLVIQYPGASVFPIPSATQGQAAIAITLEREKYLRKQE